MEIASQWFAVRGRCAWFLTMTVLLTACGGVCDVSPNNSRYLDLPESEGMTGNSSATSHAAAEDEEVLGYTPQLPLSQLSSKPGNLVLVSTPPTEIALTWDDNSDNETGFTVQRNANYTGWADIATVGADATSYVDVTAQPRGRYGYRIVAFNAENARTSNAVWTLMPAAEDLIDDDSDAPEDSNSAVGLRPAAPKLPGLSLTAEGQAQLSWTDASTDEDGFEILRYSTGLGWSVVGQAGPDITSFVDLTADSGQSYCYKVRAFNAAGVSGSAAPKCIAIPAVNDPPNDGTDPDDGCPNGDCPPGLTGPKLLPWLEINAWWLNFEDTWGPVEGSEGGVTYGQYCIRGLEYWAHVTDTVMLTAHPDGLNGAFEFMMANKPASMTIYGGVSTYSLPGCGPSDVRPWDFADAAGWRYIADEARYITRVTGNNVCILENENALAPFHRQGKFVDLQNLAIALEALRETGIEFWWYLPSIQRNSSQIPDLQARSIQLLNTIATALPNCRFIVGYVGYADWRQNTREEVTRRQMLSDLIGQSRIVDYMLATGDGYIQYEDGSSRYCHTSLDAIEDIKGLGEVNCVSIYPGHLDWVTVAREFREANKPGS